jgi:uncharacterized protein related to proFAR isomerase
MDFIPLIRMKNRNIYPGQSQDPLSLEEFLKKIDEDTKIYILDLDGIEKDKPNLCTYQRLSGSHDLWIDYGPRNLGDIVDSLTAGATDITLRRNLCHKLNISDIKEISENKIYTNIDFTEDLSFYDTDGLVNFNTREEIETNFKYGEFFKKITLKNKIYSYESDLNNIPYWKHFGIEGLLVDLNKFKEFKNAF